MQPVEKATIATQLFGGIGLLAVAVLGGFSLVGWLGFIFGKADAWGIGNGLALAIFPMVVYAICLVYLIFNKENKTARKAYKAYLESQANKGVYL